MKVLNKRNGIIPNTVYIGRPSKWGNPFMIGQLYQGRKLNRNDVIEAHRDWFLCSDTGIQLQTSLGELKNKNLLCFCAPLSCHGDLLLEMAVKF